MSDSYYFSFPKGASNVIPSAKEFLAKHGMDELSKVAKVSFKTTQSILK
jgi:ribonuclease HIII